MSLFRTIHYRFFSIPPIRIGQAATIARIRKAGKAKVVFVASSLSMWLYEGIYEKMLAEAERFEPHIVVAPFTTNSPVMREAERERLQKYFKEKGIRAEDASAMAAIDPDIVFFPQCYRKIYGEGLEISDWKKRLTCYFPYGVSFLEDRWQYDTRNLNWLWRFFVQSEGHRQTAHRLMTNKGSNVVAVGEPHAEEYEGVGRDVWKPQGTPCRRVIWAPHHSFKPESKLRRTAFLWAAGAMKELAEEYAGKIQFAFKPHPRLYVEMLTHPQWGEERTRAYFDFWRTSPNTQLEEGGFIDLFKTSDALIHNCNSFIAEYLYTGKPALFLTDEAVALKGEMNGFGRAALDSHYIAATKEEVRSFLESTVLGGDDPNRGLREEAYATYLKPVGDAGFATNVVEDIKKSIWG